MILTLFLILHEFEVNILHPFLLLLLIGWNRAGSIFKPEQDNDDPGGGGVRKRNQEEEEEEDKLG